uniref:Ribosomal protein L16 n=1 Tax=Paralemanea sp. TaxID=2048601 RepID=A0A343UXZ7_9FLOR|nr:ribosomal protein L16 [Paralemanea sp.]
MNKKCHNNYKTSTNCRRHILNFGLCGIKSVTAGRLTELHMNNLLRLINKSLKQHSKNLNSIKFWNLVHMNSTLTALSPESRMGKGKGSIYTRSCYVKPGQLLFEFSGIGVNQLKSFNSFLEKKLPMKTKIVF